MQYYLEFLLAYFKNPNATLTFFIEAGVGCECPSGVRRSEQGASRRGVTSWTPDPQQQVREPWHCSGAAELLSPPESRVLLGKPRRGRVWAQRMCRKGFQSHSVGFCDPEPPATLRPPPSQGPIEV